MVSDQDLQKALENPDEFDWQDPIFERRLRQRLHKSYDSFLFNVGGMRDTLNELKKRLGVDSDGKIEWIDQPLMIRALKAGVLSFRKPVYEELITNLKGHNRALQELTQQTERLYQTRRKRGQASRLKKLRGRAEGLLRALRGLGCSCSGVHSAGIELLPQPISLKDDDSETQRLRTQCSFTNVDGTGKQQSISISMDTLIETMKEPAPPKPMTLQNNKGKKSVKWNYESKKTKSLDDRTWIQKLCQIFTPKPSQYICFTAEKLDFVFWQSESVPTNYPGTSLARALESQNQTLSRLDKLALSTALAYSVLWLHPTDWMEHNFNISKFHVVDIKASDRNPSFKRLYLNHEMPSSQLISSSTLLTAPMNPSLQRLPSTQSMPGATKFTEVFALNSNGDPQTQLTRAHSLPKLKQENSNVPSLFIQNESMFSLGLALLQLCLGKPLAQLESSQDQHTDQQIMNLATAKRLLNSQKILEEGGTRFDTAIRCCIWGDPKCPRNDLEDDDFRQSVYDNVVSPLEDEFDQFRRT
jgi:hypothetical protein